MCTSPIRILNRKKHFVSFADPIYYIVPCGKCPECVAMKRKEWQFRARREMMDTQFYNGFGMFITLTFDNEHLPHFNVNPLGKDNAVYPAFSKDEVKKFLKRLRQQLKRKFGYEGMRHLICSEYGDKRDRPHHHGALFFPNPPKELTYITVQNLIGCSKADCSSSNGRVLKNHLKDFIKQHSCAWRCGLVDFSDREIDGTDGIDYVCKYITKDYAETSHLYRAIVDRIKLQYADEFNSIQELLEVERSSYPSQLAWDVHVIKNTILAYEEYKKLYNEYTPFHLQSKGFGLSALGSITDDDFLNGYIVLPNQLDKNGLPKKQLIPPYYVRKKYYVCNEDGLYVPTQEGLQYLKQVREKTIHDSYDKSDTLLRFSLNLLTSDRKENFANKVSELCEHKLYSASDLSVIIPDMLSRLPSVLNYRYSKLHKSTLNGLDYLTPTTSQLINPYAYDDLYVNYDFRYCSYFDTVSQEFHYPPKDEYNFNDDSSGYIDNMDKLSKLKQNMYDVHLTNTTLVEYNILLDGLSRYYSQTRLDSLTAKELSFHIGKKLKLLFGNNSKTNSQNFQNLLNHAFNKNKKKSCFNTYSHTTP